MQNKFEVIDELDYVILILNLTRDTLIDSDEPVQLDFFIHPPQVIIGDDGQQLIISVNDIERLKRPILIKNEY